MLWHASSQGIPWLLTRTKASLINISTTQHCEKIMGEIYSKKLSYFFWVKPPWELQPKQSPFFSLTWCFLFIGRVKSELSWKWSCTLLHLSPPNPSSPLWAFLCQQIHWPPTSERNLRKHLTHLFFPLVSDKGSLSPVNQQSSSQCSSRNWFQVISAPYCILLSSDNWLSPHELQKGSAPMQNTFP